MRHTLAIAALLSSLPFVAQAADPIALRLASATVPTSKVNVWGLIPWSEDVKKASNDLLDIKLYYNNSIANPDNVYSRTLEGVADISFDNVVTEHNADRFVIRKMLHKQKRVRDAAFAFLICIVQMLQSKLFAVSEQSQEITRRIPTGNDHNVFYPRIYQRSDGIIDHRLVVNRK